MEKVLVVAAGSSGKELAGLLRELIPGAAVTLSTAAGDARGKILDGEWDLVVLSLPLPGESGESLASLAASETLAALIALITPDFLPYAQEALEPYGVLVAARPPEKREFSRILSLARSVHNRLAGMGRRNEELERKLEEIKTVDRAKWVLMEKRGMSENEAHRWIETEAMNRRISRYAIAEGILRTGP